MKNVIFDLDMTLVDSSVAESARRQRNWQEVYSLIPSFTLYPGMSEVFDFIRDNNIRVAIVSTSPRLYVERVCQHFNIPTNVILGYHDCGRIKPAPDGMIRALNEIGSSAQDAVSFGDRAIDIQASNTAGITSVACLWGTQERTALVSSNPSEIILFPKGIITLLKCYDGSEIKEMNKKKIKAKEEEERKACEEEERKRREAEQKHQDELDIARAETIARYFPIFKQFFSDQSTVSINAHEARLIIQRESSIKSFQDTISRMNNCVSNWKSARGIPHWFFYYYYPTRYADVSMDSKHARTLIYDFKDGREHDTVKNLVVNKMRSTFSPYDISQMTFVCIPASTRAVHESRYKNFAADVTQALGMANAYDYITIIKEKTPSHLGGSDSAEYSFNPSFFKGKIIVMFDDVVTSGKSVALMKSTMESLGATVICVLSIGQTYSDWNCNTPQPHPQTGRI